MQITDETIYNIKDSEELKNNKNQLKLLKLLKLIEEQFLRTKENDKTRLKIK